MPVEETQCQAAKNIRTRSDYGIGAQSGASKIARKGDGRADDFYHLSAAGQLVLEAAQAVLGPSGPCPTVAVKRRRTSDVWLSPQQFARQFGVGTSAVYGAVERGEVPAIRLGRHIRLPPDSVEIILRFSLNGR